jgi:hypothetical protein
MRGVINSGLGDMAVIVLFMEEAAHHFGNTIQRREGDEDNPAGLVRSS